MQKWIVFSLLALAGCGVERPEAEQALLVGGVVTETTPIGPSADTTFPTPTATPLIGVQPTPISLPHPSGSPVTPVPPAGIFRGVVNGVLTGFQSSGTRYCALTPLDFEIVTGQAVGTDFSPIYVNLPSASLFDGLCRLDPLVATATLFRGSSLAKFDQLYTRDRPEIEAKGFRYELEYPIFSAEWYRVMKALYRCYRQFDHWISLSPLCEGLGVSEGQLGFVSRLQLPATVPLISFQKENEHIVTPHLAMQAHLRQIGWIENGTLGFVPEPPAISDPKLLLTLRERMPASGEVLYGEQRVEYPPCNNCNASPGSSRTIYTFPANPGEVTHAQNVISSYAPFRFLIYLGCPSSDFAPVYRCSQKFQIGTSNAYWEKRFLSRDANCEGQIKEGIVGYVLKTQIEGTVPLVRYTHAHNATGGYKAVHYITSAPALRARFEKDCLIKEGILGYVSPAGPPVDQEENFLKGGNFYIPPPINRSHYSSYSAQCR